MDQQPDQAEKTEQPTPKKIEDALKKGQTPFSRELPAFASMLGMLGLFALWAVPATKQFSGELANIMGSSPTSMAECIVGSTRKGPLRRPLYPRLSVATRTPSARWIRLRNPATTGLLPTPPAVRLPIQMPVADTSNASAARIFRRVISAYVQARGESKKRSNGAASRDLGSTSLDQKRGSLIRSCPRGSKLAPGRLTCATWGRENRLSESWSFRPIQAAQETQQPAHQHHGQSRIPGVAIAVETGP